MCFSSIIAEILNPDFLFMITHAVKAPSGHNTQPWLFKIDGNRIEIHPDYTKSLPVVDTENRELFISLGCALENLCLAAMEKNYESVVTVTEKGVISVDLFPSDTIITPCDLFAQIPVRQTNRSVYNGKRIPRDTISALGNKIMSQNIHIHFYENGTARFDSIKRYVESGNRIQMKDKAFKTELKEWMRFNKKHSEEKKDGLSYRVFGAPNLPALISKPVIGLAINERSQVKGDNKKIASSSHFALFTVKENTCKEWIQLGRILQRFLLITTEMGIVHSYLNQPNEVQALSEQMANALNLKEEYPVILLRLGYGDKMPYSGRKGIESVIIQDSVGGI
ncbi:MAG: nitroreductase [Candidatus Azobacteroides sp.]|nr:nitroreductase [Candidatus Azobacteroides sp.]